MSAASPPFWASLSYIPKSGTLGHAARSLARNARAALTLGLSLWVVYGLLRHHFKIPAGPRINAPVQTDAVHWVVRCTRRSHSSTSSATILTGRRAAARYDDQVRGHRLVDGMLDAEEKPTAFGDQGTRFLADEADLRPRNTLKHLPSADGVETRDARGREGSRSEEDGPRSLLTGRGLRVRVVMTDDTPGRGAQLAVSCHMAGDAADDGPLDAALGVRSGRQSEGNCGYASRCHNPFHVRSPVVEDPEINAIRTTSVPAARR
jgi:hypothetical protein